MLHYINESLSEHISVISQVRETLIPQIENAAKLAIQAIIDNKKILFMGNGGSAADAQHCAAELVGRYLKERKAIRAISLSTDTSILTALGNDYGVDKIFSRQIEALAESGDVCFAFSTSGNSPNILSALEKAQELGCICIGLTGESGGMMKGKCDILLNVPSNHTPRIQEAHITIGHILCGLIEESICDAK